MAYRMRGTGLRFDWAGVWLTLWWKVSCSCTATPSIPRTRPACWVVWWRHEAEVEAEVEAETVTVVQREAAAYLQNVHRVARANVHCRLPARGVHRLQ